MSQQDQPRKGCNVDAAYPLSVAKMIREQGCQRVLDAPDLLAWVVQSAKVCIRPRAGLWSATGLRGGVLSKASLLPHSAGAATALTQGPQIASA